MCVHVYLAQEVRNFLLSDFWMLLLPPTFILVELFLLNVEPLTLKGPVNSQSEVIATGIEVEEKPEEG